MRKFRTLHNQVAGTEGRLTLVTGNVVVEPRPRGWMRRKLRHRLLKIDGHTLGWVLVRRPTAAPGLGADGPGVDVHYLVDGDIDAPVKLNWRTPPKVRCFRSGATAAAALTTFYPFRRCILDHDRIDELGAMVFLENDREHLTLLHASRGGRVVGDGYTDETSTAEEATPEAEATGKRPAATSVEDYEHMERNAMV